MKNNFYLLIAVFFAVFASTLNVQAQTDVTATYLTNAGFNNSCNYLASDAAANLVVANGGANIKVVPGWTIGTIGDNSASAAFEYGYAGSLNLSGTTYGFIPTQGPNAATGAGNGSLGVSVAWAATVTYYQTVTLPVGKYSIEYAAYNSGPNATNYSKVGWVPTSGTSVVSAKTSFTMAAWTTETLTITVATPTTGKIQVGIGSPNTGSATVGRIFFDYVKLTELPVDKAELQTQLGIAAAMYGSQQPVGASTVYADLNSAIVSAQAVYDNASATVVQVLGQEAALKTAIANVNSAITLQTRATTWTTFPYNATSVIVNPSFENAIGAEWLNPNSFARPNSTAMGAYKAGTYFVEKYVGNPGNQINLNISQVINNIPNGIYRVTAGAQAIQQATPATYPGKAYIFANADSTEVFIVNNYTVQTIVTNNTLKIGFVTKTTGNWVALDNFQLSYLGDPKSVLNSLISTANGMIASPQNVGASTVYTALGSAVSAAQLVSNNASATTIEIAAQETAMNTAIANVNGAILLQTRKDTWTTLPMNVTSVITNPSFEISATSGWTNVGGFGAQSNNSFALKAGTFYVEKWQGSGNWTGLKLSQRIINIPNGVYSLTAAALNDPNTTGGAFVFANAVTAEVFTSNDYSVTVTVTNNELEIGYEVVNGGNYVGVDNFRLTYVSDGSPYVILNPTTLFFDPISFTKTFVVTGANLAGNLSLTPPTGISLDKTSLTPSEVAAGSTVTATFDKATAIIGGTITATSGAVSQNVTVNASADLSCFTPLYSTLTNIITDPFCNSLTGFAGWGGRSIEPTYIHCGLNSIKITGKCGGSLDFNLTGKIQGNKTYQVKAMVSTNGTGETKIGISGATAVGLINTISTAAGEWLPLTFTFTTQETITSANMFLNSCETQTATESYIDNFEMYDITSTITDANELSANKEFRAYVADKYIATDFNLLQTSEVQFSVYNMQGMLISKEKATYAAGQNHKVISTNLPSGMYMVNMTSNGKSVTQKVVR